jgi:hypothetical protein
MATVSEAQPTLAQPAQTRAHHANVFLPKLDPPRDAAKLFYTGAIVN